MHSSIDRYQSFLYTVQLPSLDCYQLIQRAEILSTMFTFTEGFMLKCLVIVIITELCMYIVIIFISIVHAVEVYDCFYGIIFEIFVPLSWINASYNFDHRSIDKAALQLTATIRKFHLAAFQVVVRNF